MAKAEILIGPKSIPYPGTLDVMNILGMTYATDSIVIDGNIVTSWGPSIAMEFALTLIELTTDRTARVDIEGPLLH